MSPASPSSGCTRCSTAARRAPASPSPTTARSRSSRTWASVSQVFDEQILAEPIGQPRHRPRALLAPPAPAPGRTRSRSPAAATATSSPSATTATSSTRPSCATSSMRQGVKFESAPPTPRSSRRSSPSTPTATSWARCARPSARSAAPSRATVLTGEAVVGFRDPYGVRPLCLGDFEGHPVIASESWAFDIIGAEFVREIEPGEIVFATNERRRCAASGSSSPGARPALCIFEFIYFARPDSRHERQDPARGCRSEMGAPPGPGGAGRRRPRHPGAGHRHLGGHRLRARQRHPLHRGPASRTATSTAPSSSPTTTCASSASA